MFFRARHCPAVIIGALMAMAACGGKSKGPSAVKASNVTLGDCANPRKDGVLSKGPKLVPAFRDLNGDGQEEPVYADARLCRKGQCYWNVFSRQNGCHRYLGTVAGKVLEPMPVLGEHGYISLRTWWPLSEGRQLAHEYKYRNGAYRLSEVLVCRDMGAAGLQCAREEPKSE